jgi:hypothetical protein
MLATGLSESSGTSRDTLNGCTQLVRSTSAQQIRWAPIALLHLKHNRSFSHFLRFQYLCSLSLLLSKSRLGRSLIPRPHAPQQRYSEVIRITGLTGSRQTKWYGVLCTEDTTKGTVLPVSRVKLNKWCNSKHSPLFGNSCCPFREVE